MHKGSRVTRRHGLAEELEVVLEAEDLELGHVLGNVDRADGQGRGLELLGKFVLNVNETSFSEVGFHYKVVDLDETSKFVVEVEI